MTAVDLCRGVAKLVKALDFDSSIRRFDSFHPCQIYRAFAADIDSMSGHRPFAFAFSVFY
jgi:hypothetical protein